MEPPGLIYGTAWKEERTQSLVERALRQGFRGIDTANQRKHYDEAAVGRGVAACIAGGVVRPEELFLQTKFTFRRGQDDRLPYDPRANIETQVEQSLTSSLEHLGVACINSYLLHGPSRSVGLGPDDWAAWRAMEDLCDSGRTRSIGVSNVTLEQLRQLCDFARVLPAFVQNRCYAATGWDRQIRAWCAAQGIGYQGFSLLTANRQVLSAPEIRQIAERLGRSIPEIVFRFALDVGMHALTGTTNVAHMGGDLAIEQFQLNGQDVALIERLAET